MSSNLDSNLNFRMTSNDKKVIETAAKLKGLKANTYARKKLIEAAEKDIAEISNTNLLTLSPKDWEFFVKVMEEPVKENLYFKRAVKKYKKTFGL